MTTTVIIRPYYNMWFAFSHHNLPMIVSLFGFGLFWSLHINVNFMQHAIYNIHTTTTQQHTIYHYGSYLIRVTDELSICRWCFVLFVDLFALPSCPPSGLCIRRPSQWQWHRLYVFYFVTLLHLSSNMFNMLCWRSNMNNAVSTMLRVNA